MTTAYAGCLRFGSLSCGTSRKIGAVTLPRPVLERDTTV